MEDGLVKQKVQRWIVSLSIIILIGKFLAFYLTNSVGILTDAMESIVNVIAGLISLFSLYLSAKPKDKSHPFGHGKIELISASVEGILIMIAGGLIIYEAVKRIPKGHVATYRQVAKMAGNEKMSRAVGNALHKNPDPDHIPCFRVVNAKGELAGAFAFSVSECVFL